MKFPSKLCHATLFGIHFPEKDLFSRVSEPNILVTHPRKSEISLEDPPGPLYE